MDDPTRLRAFDHAIDTAYVCQTWHRSWLKNHRSGSLRNTPNARRDFALRLQRDVIGPALRDARIMILCASDTPSTIHAWAAAHRGALLFAYVPKELRGVGFGRRVVEAALGCYPDRIVTRYRWPLPSRRYVLEPMRRAA